MKITTFLSILLLVRKNKILLHYLLEFWLQKNYFCALKTTCPQTGTTHTT